FCCAVWLDPFLHALVGHRLWPTLFPYTTLFRSRPAVADLERGHRDARLGHQRLLAADLRHVGGRVLEDLLVGRGLAHAHVERDLDRKSTRLNSSHVKISYAVFCLKKKNVDNSKA